MTPVQYIGIAFFVAGAIMGSFGNMLVHRLPNNLRLTGRSLCPKCKHVLSPIDLIPIVSYIFLGGRCRTCALPIPLQYLLVELSSAVLFVLAFWQAPTLLSAVILAFTLWCLLLITVIDYHTQGIPDLLSFPFIGLSILYAALLQQLDLLTFAVCSGFFALQWLVSWGRWVGSGDVLLSLGISALLGRVDFALMMLCIAYIVGALVALQLLSKKQKTAQDRLAFGPFLAIGTFIVLFWGDAILTNFYL